MKKVNVTGLIVGSFLFAFNGMVMPVGNESDSSKEIKRLLSKVPFEETDKIEYDERVTSLAISSSIENHSLLVTGSSDGKVRVYDFNNDNELIKEIDHGNNETVNTIAFNGSQNVFATGSNDKKVRFYKVDDLEKDEPHKTFEFENKVRSLGLSYINDLFMAGCGWENIGSLYVCSLRHDRMVKEYYEDTYDSHIAVSSHWENNFFAITSGKVVRIFDFSQMDASSLDHAFEDAGEQRIHFHGEEVFPKALAFNGDGKILAVADHEYTVYLVKTANGQIIQKLWAGNTISFLSFNGLGNRLSVGLFQSVCLFEKSEDEEYKSTQRLSPLGFSFVYPAVLTRSGNTVVLGHGDGIKGGVSIFHNGYGMAGIKEGKEDEITLAAAIEIYNKSKKK